MFGGEGGEGCVGDVVIHPRASFHAAIHKKSIKGYNDWALLMPRNKNGYYPTSSQIPDSD